MTDAAALLALAGGRSETVAVAESLTGGLVLAALTAVPGSSSVVRGGVVAYGVDLKASVLGVDEGLLRDGGPVQAEVAAQMARGVARLCGATWGLATTGVAGPGPADGHPAGTVYVAVARARGDDGAGEPSTAGGGPARDRGGEEPGGSPALPTSGSTAAPIPTVSRLIPGLVERAAAGADRAAVRAVSVDAVFRLAVDTLTEHGRTAAAGGSGGRPLP